MVAALGVLVIGMICVSSAVASPRRGHVFTSSFGASGEATKFLPTAIAVNEASSGEGAGDAYVLERLNNRVMVYGPAPKREFLEAWGYGVSDGKAEYERCIAPAKCLPGIAGQGKNKPGAFNEPVAIAIDNAAGSPSKGDVYIVANNKTNPAAVDKFTAGGKLLGALPLFEPEDEPGEPEGPIAGVAVDPSGKVFIEREDEEEDFELVRLSDEQPNKLLDVSEIEVPEGIDENERPIRPGFAVDGNDDLYVTYEPGGKDAEEIKEEKPHERLDGACENHPCLVAKFVTIPAAGGGVEAVEESTLDAFDNLPVSGVAVGPADGGSSSGEAFIDHLEGVRGYSASGALEQQFGQEQLAARGGAGLTVDGATNEVLVADDVEGRIDTFVQAPAEAQDLSVGGVTSSAAELHADLNPEGREVKFRFQYGTAECAGGPCAETPTQTLKAGLGLTPIEAPVSELAPSATYRFRVLVEEVGGSGAVATPEVTFKTRSSVAEAALPDGRAWELVTPPAKHGATVLPLQEEGGLIQAAADGGGIAFVTLGAETGEVAGERGPEPTQRLAKRSKPKTSGESTSWSSEDIASPNEEHVEGFNPGGPWEYQYFSSDLKSAFLAPYSPALLGGANERTIYVRNNEACTAKLSTCYLPLVSSLDDTAEPPQPFGSEGGLHGNFEGATEDLQHVVFRSGVPLTKTAAPIGNGLYMWSAEDHQLQLVSVLPNGTQAFEGLVVGAGTFEHGKQSTTAISDDGSRVVFTKQVGTAVAGEPAPHEPTHIYMRELEHEGKAARSYLVDAPDTGAPASVPSAINQLNFQGATPNGSKVFFTDTQALTSAVPLFSGKTSQKQSQELYVFEAEKPEGERVTDLSPTLGKGESAEVRGAMLGQGEDDEGNVTAYFAANSALASGSEKGDCHDSEAGAALLHCTAYVVRYSAASKHWSLPKAVARLSDADSPDWGGPSGGATTAYAMKHLVARTSPNGRYLAFMSSESLTGYDNVDANSGARDEEVFLYDSSDGRLVCASCNPSGSRPVGVFDEQEGSGEGVNLVVDRPQTWEPGGAELSGTGEGEDPWLAANLPSYMSVGVKQSYHQPRFLSNSGRLFFNSADALTHVLVPTRLERINGVEKPVGVENVYQYEPTGTGGCTVENTDSGCVTLLSSGESAHESAFLDASENGDDVFFLTSQRLVPQDFDSEYDIYDARVCEAPGSEPCATAPVEPPPPCADEAGCRSAAPPAAPPFGAPATTSGGGSGNIVAAAHGVLNEKKVETPKPQVKPTKAQLLAKALKACKKDKKKNKRHACEKAAHKKYPVKSTAKKSGIQHTTAGSAAAKGQARR